MTYQVHYESKPGMWELYSGTKTVEADDEEAAIDIAYRLIRRDFPDRSRQGWYFTVNCDLCKDGGNSLGLDCDGCLLHWLQSEFNILAADC